MKNALDARDGAIHSWNAGTERLFGYTADEILGKSVAAVLLGSHEVNLRMLNPQVIRS